MRIREIRWIDKDSNEASVVVSDGFFECLAFCHPCHLTVGDKILEPLQSLGESGIYLVKHKNIGLKQQSGNDSWNHELVGLVLNKDRNLVQVGRLEIILNSLPGDVINGDFVECYPIRLDIIR